MDCGEKKLEREEKKVIILKKLFLVFLSVLITFSCIINTKAMQYGVVNSKEMGHCGSMVLLIPAS